MTPELARPGLRLLKSLLAEERIGRPGAARDQALAAAQADAANAHVHLLDAAYAALVAGEPRAADRLLAQCEATAPRDDPWPRRIAATRVWSSSADRFWYPGEFAAEETRSINIPKFPEARPGDPETVLVEAIANAAHSMRVFRMQVELARENPENAQASMGLVHENAQRLQEAVQGAFDEAVEGESRALTVFLGFADLLHRAGRPDDADQVLADARQDHQVLAANGVANPVGRACTFLVEGDWYATPGSSPEALGFDLATLSGPSPFLARRDLVRAAAAYDRAEELLAGVDEPRAHGALALRRAALAWLSADHAAQQAFLAQAASAFAAAGDVAACRLTTAHGLLAGIALGHVAETRRLAGRDSISSRAARSRTRFAGESTTAASAGRPASGGCSSAPPSAGTQTATTSEQRSPTSWPFRSCPPAGSNRPRRSCSISRNSTGETGSECGRSRAPARRSRPSRPSRRLAWTSSTGCGA
jgi:hypothetical protein